MTFPTTNDNAADLLTYLLTPQDLAETLTSGTALQNTGGSLAFLCLGITGGTAGTVKVDIGPTSACADNLFPATAADAVASQNITVPVPIGWYVKVTVAVATIANAQLFVL